MFNRRLFKNKRYFLFHLLFGSSLHLTELKNIYLKINVWLLKKLYLSKTKKIEDHNPEITKVAFKDKTS